MREMERVKQGERKREGGKRGNKVSGKRANVRCVRLAPSTLSRATIEPSVIPLIKLYISSPIWKARSSLNVVCGT